MNVSATLKAWRGVAAAYDRGNFTQEEAAARLGVPLKTYLDWEQGRHAPRGFALQALQQKLESGKSAGATLPSNRKRPRPKSRSSSPAANGGRTKRVTHAKKTSTKKRR